MFPSAKCGTPKILIHFVPGGVRKLSFALNSTGGLWQEFSKKMVGLGGESQANEPCL